MFLTRPRVRFNGVYISTCNYIRPGIGQNWNSPIHMVTYYRYLRLYRDGTCINLLSTDEPNDVVPLFNKLTPGSSGYTASITRSDGTIIFRPKKIYPGTWSFDESFGEIYDTIEKKHKKISSKANLMIETEGSVKKYKFCMDLEMSNGSKNTKFNKLSWQRFYFQNIITLENEDLYLKNDKPFHFSRVLSYER
ncbi:hypothetical protein NADFUDRAFT_82415 [Nadsonia fulvescens var. elongata DSM 6958]|uniref:F-box protein Hrt3/FBXO9 C-terminal domain-containing protein n=1 Tax=Nadsonia fulvescens var. elongata DSM 6958 TaxID=857566 RepID=A0A1E3PMV9_9ASCO|nr:hypothetical protein NADFUDRAFT_82415 [Nadsonia fulvescens var. elongata DSM 6958]